MVQNSTLFPSTRYLFDTSGFIRLDKNFPRENPVFTAIWEEIEDLLNRGELCTIDYVEEEINRYEGKETFLQKWIKRHRRSLVRSTTEECIVAAIPIINAEYSTGFLKQQKQASGVEEADPFLIAYAQVHGHILVTDESFVKPNRIPQVATKYNVQCLSIYDFIQERGLMMIRRPSS